jgi:hypothetical protein
MSGERQRSSAHFVVAFSIAWSAVVSCSAPVSGATPAPSSNQDSQAQKSNPDQQDPDYNGEDFTRPQRSVEARILYETSSGTSSQTDRETWLLRANWKSDLSAGWTLGLLGQVPIVDKNTLSPTGTDQQLGVGDAAFQGALSHAIDEHWAFGFGARLVAPTAEDSLGSGKWQIMPGVGVRYSFLEIGPDTYFVPVVRYAVSFAGDPSRRNISEPQIAPTLNIGLQDHWFVNFYPSNDIRINFGNPISGQTGRLFLPLDVSVGRKIADSWIISLELGVPVVDDYPVYKFKTELRIVKQF